MVTERLANTSRSHNRLIKDINKASERRQQLLDAGKLSLPSGAGKLAIIVSRVPDYGAGKLTPEKQRQAFLEEADRLRQERAQDHQAVVVRPMAVIGDMKIDFGDREVTDIILIGHGSISAMWADNGKHFDWQTAARAASYLKQGKLEQRMCGNLPYKKAESDIPGAGHIEELPHKYSVPLGTFAVSELANLTAATGMSIPNVNPADELFRPVFPCSKASVPEQIQAFNEMYANLPTLIVK